jgi:hypothetical protein
MGSIGDISDQRGRPRLVGPVVEVIAARTTVASRADNPR